MILGVVGLFGPCTGYRVRQVFLQSLSPYWSGSAGAIYPALRRLDRLRLIEQADDHTTRRPSKLLSLSPAGSKALVKWLKPPLSRAALMDVDPLRTRVRMLGLVPAAERRRFVTSACKQLAELERDARALLRESQQGDDPFHTLVCKGAVDTLRTRHRWLKEVAAAVGVE
jgi:DNA-binding PadR family transcriptional regulator